MGNTFDGFGESLLGSSSEAQQTGTAQTLTPEQNQLLTNIIGQVTPQLGQGAETYQGDMVADPSGMQQGTWSLYRDLINGGYQGPNQQGQQAIDQVLSGTQGTPDAVTAQQASPQQVNVADYNPDATRNWWNEAVVNPAVQNWQENTAPGLQEYFISNNAGSSGAANRAIAGSAADLQSGLNATLANQMNQERLNTQNNQLNANMFNASNDLTAQQQAVGNQFTADTNAANMQFQAGQNDLQRFLNVPGMASTNDSTGLNNWLNSLNAANSAGQQITGFDQANIDAGYNNWLSGQSYNNPWLGMIGSALGTTAFEPIVQGPTQQQGFLQSVVTPIVSGYAAGGGFN